MSDFVKPEVVRVPLSGGQFVDIKKRLSHGEREDMYAGMYEVTAQGATLNRTTARTKKALMYLVGWSLTDDGAPVPMSPQVDTDTRLATLRSLSIERFDEIYDAIQAHEEGAAAKKLPDGENKSSAISPSPSDADCGTSGSESSMQMCTTS